MSRTLVAYVPFNNQGLGVIKDWERTIVEVIFSAMSEHHLKTADDQFVLLLYLTKMSDCFVPEMKDFPPRMTGVDVHVRKKFDRTEGDGIALAMAGGNPKDIVCFRLVREGSMSPGVKDRILQEERARFGWAYCLTAAVEGD